MKLIGGNPIFALAVMAALFYSCGGEDFQSMCRSLQPCDCYKKSNKRIIDCSNKNLPSIPNFVGVSGTHFHSILLNDNSITVIPRNAFANLDVKLINLSNNPLSSLSDRAIQNTHGVEEVYLKNCTLNRAPYPLSMLYQLKKLDMSYNDISTLSHRSFANMKNLTYLNLSHNRRLQFPDPFTAFDNLTNLEYLDLSYCGLFNFPLGTAVKHVSQLKTVLLKNNSIASLRDKVLSKSPKLEVLDLDNNPLSLSNDRVFNGLYRLRVLKLGACSIPTIKKSIFKDLYQLETLSFHHCDVEKIDKNFLGEFSRLTVLDIGGNPSIKFTQELISGLENQLTELGISDMKIERFPKDIITEFSELRVLNVSSNRITELKEGDLASIHHANAEIYLDNNKINHISSRVTDGLRRPFTLSLRNNNLTTLSFLWEFPCLFARSVVDVWGNPIHCDCALFSLVQQKNIKLEGSCQTPTQYRGIKLVPPYGEPSSHVRFFEVFMDKMCRKGGEERFTQRFDCGCNEWREITSSPCTLSRAPYTPTTTASQLVLLLSGSLLTPRLLHL